MSTEFKQFCQFFPPHTRCSSKNPTGWHSYLTLALYSLGIYLFKVGPHLSLWKERKKDEQKDRAGYAVVLLLFLVFNSELQEDLHFQEESLSSKLNINKQLLHERHKDFFLSIRKISICVVRVADTETVRHEIFVPPPPSTRSKNPPPSFFVFVLGGFLKIIPKKEEM